ncbi:MAG: MFS transporter, partial [Candidatus Micrarchaeia archaeon]
DLLGKKNVALLGNLLIPILSFTGFSSSSAEATALFSTGWWARNFRTPARRAMIGDISSRLDKGKVYGFLNALDVGGGIVAILYLSIGIYLGVALRLLFLVTIVPLLISSLCLALVKYKGNANNGMAEKKGINANAAALAAKVDKAYKAVLVATALFGLSFYSMSFPVLTIAQESTSLYGVASYALFLLLSAIFGYASGALVKRRVLGLALYGYMLAGAGSLAIGLSYYLGLGAIGSYFGVALMGVALGSIETLEPTIISLVKPKRHSGSGMGSLTASRSIGHFFANLVLDLLYTIGPLYAYSFAASMAILAGLVLLSARSKL